MDSDKLLEYGWVFAIAFFLVLFLSQALYIWILGPVGSVFAWLLLIIWSFWATYFLLFGRTNSLLERIREKVASFVRKEPLHKEQIDLREVPELERMGSKPKDPVQEDTRKMDALEKKLESIAHNKGVLVSGEALRLAAQNGKESESIFESMIEEAKKTYPRFDGWVVLNKEQISELLPKNVHTTKFDETPTLPLEEQRQEEPKHSTEKEEKKEVEDSWKEKLAEYHKNEKKEASINNTPIPVNLPTGQLQSKQTHATARLIELLCKGDEDELFTFIRGMRQGGEKGVREFIREAVLLLDAVHEHRVDGVGYVEQEILEHTQCFSNEEIEEIIAILIGSIDYRYKLPDLGVKLALVRAIEYIKKARKN